MLSVTVSRRQYYPNIKRNVETATHKAAMKAREIAVQLTSGTVSTEQLRRMGHPFGRNAPSPRAKGRKIGSQRGSLPRLPINRQTGYLQESIRVTPQFSAEGTKWKIDFTAHYAQFVLNPGGTSKMVARGFWTAFHNKMKPVLRAEMQGIFKP